MLYKPTVAENFRETRDFACEVKFLLNTQQAVAIRDWARAHLTADPHGSGEYGDSYRVSSAYYDTRELAVYQRQGSYGRSKYRVRRYGAADHVFLERKTHTSEQVSKRRSVVPIEDLQRLAHPLQPDWAGYWFRRRLQVRALSPVCCVDYRRIARTAHTETGPCRLTLDGDVRALPCNNAAHLELYDIERDGQPLLHDKPYVLELKYRYTLPMVFRQLLVEFAPQPQRFSKYRRAMQVLAPASAELPDGAGRARSESAAC